MNENPKIIHELAFILQDLVLRIELMPKSKKIIIGSILVNNIVETINYCHEGLQGLSESKILASARFNTFKLLLKNTYEMKLIPESIYSIYIEKTANIGRMLGGWIKYEKKSVLQTANAATIVVRICRIVVIQIQSIIVRIDIAGRFLRKSFPFRQIRRIDSTRKSCKTISSTTLCFSYEEGMDFKVLLAKLVASLFEITIEVKYKNLPVPTNRDWENQTQNQVWKRQRQSPACGGRKNKSVLRTANAATTAVRRCRIVVIQKQSSKARNDIAGRSLFCNISCICPDVSQVVI